MKDDLVSRAAALRILDETCNRMRAAFDEERAEHTKQKLLLLVIGFGSGTLLGVMLARAMGAP